MRVIGPHEVLVVDDGSGPEVQVPAVVGEAGGASPVDLALVSLCWCQAVTYRVWASRLGIVVSRLSVEAEADFDQAGMLGQAGALRPGFGAVRLHVSIQGPDPERHAELRATVDEHCPMLDVYANPVPVTTTLDQAGT